MKKLFALVLSVAMLCSISATSFATYDDSGLALGTLTDDEGTDLCNQQDAPMYPGANARSFESLRFSFRANAVYDLLTTRSSNKTVTTYNSSDDYLITGQPHYDPRPTEVAYCRAGLCYYDSNMGIYYSPYRLHSDNFSDEYGGEVYVKASYLSGHITYYAFCKNLLNTDGDDTYVMSGNFYVYDVYPY